MLCIMYSVKVTPFKPDALSASDEMNTVLAVDMSCHHYVKSWPCKTCCSDDCDGTTGTTEVAAGLPAKATGSREAHLQNSFAGS